MKFVIDMLAFMDYICDSGLAIADHHGEYSYTSENLKRIVITHDGNIELTYCSKHKSGCDTITLEGIEEEFI